MIIEAVGNPTFGITEDSYQQRSHCLSYRNIPAQGTSYRCVDTITWARYVHHRRM